MRSSILIAVLLVACGKQPTPQRPIGSGSAGGSATVATTSGGGAKPSPGGPSTVRDIGCLRATCVFHAGAAAYFTCQASGAGTCFHFGSPCTPEGACMYDAAARSYKQCTKPLEGTCQAWGGACTPASKCMWDPRDGLHRTCDAIDGGTCKKFGALCAP